MIRKILLYKKIILIFYLPLACLLSQQCRGKTDNFLRVKFNKEGGAGFRCFLKKVEGIKYFEVNSDEPKFIAITFLQGNANILSDEEKNNFWGRLRNIKDKYSLIMEIKNNSVKLYSDECKEMNSEILEEIKNITFKTKIGNFPMTEFLIIQFSKESKYNFPCEFEKENPVKNCYRIYYFEEKENEVRNKILDYRLIYVDGIYLKPKDY